MLVWERITEYLPIFVKVINSWFITALNEVGARLYFHRCLWFCSQGGGGGIPACIAGSIPACLAPGLQGGGIPACLAGYQAHTQVGSLGGSGWGGLQAHTQGEVEGDLARECLLPGGWLLWGVCSRGCGDPPDGYCCGQYASYWNAFLFNISIQTWHMDINGYKKWPRVDLLDFKNNKILSLLRWMKSHGIHENLMLSCPFYFLFWPLPNMWWKLNFQ